MGFVQVGRQRLFDFVTQRASYRVFTRTRELFHQKSNRLKLLQLNVQPHRVHC